MKGARRTAGQLAAIAASAVGVAAGLHIFVLRAAFAPSGVDGLAALLQHLSVRLGTPVSAGVFSLLLNLPLLLLAARVMSRRYVLYTLFYTSLLSLFLLLFAHTGLYQYDCLTPGTGNEPLLAAIFGGAAQGLTAIPLRLGGSSGGVDIVGGMLAVRMPHKNVERLISYVSYLVVGLVLLVFRDLGSVCLSVISIFVCERVSTAFLRPARGALRIELVAPRDAALRGARFVTEELSRHATLTATESADGAPLCSLVAVVGYRQLAPLYTFLAGEPSILLHYTEVLGSRGAPP